MPEWNDDDELDTRKPLILRVVAVVVIVGLVVYIADLFFRLLVEGF
jgi:preprotein translocase subunit SecE